METPAAPPTHFLTAMNTLSMTCTGAQRMGFEIRLCAIIAASLGRLLLASGFCHILGNGFAGVTAVVKCCPVQEFGCGSKHSDSFCQTNQPERLAI